MTMIYVAGAQIAADSAEQRAEYLAGFDGETDRKDWGASFEG